MNTNTRATPAESGRGQGNGSEHTHSVIMHPATGEVFDEHALDREPPENLADLLLALREHQAAVRRAERVVEQVLAAAMATRKRRKWVVGEYEIEQGTRNSRVWDGEQLAATLTALVDDGVVTAQEVAAVIERKWIVKSREATSLQNRLVGDAQRAVDDCWAWERKPTGSLSVVRSIPLVAEGDEHD